MENRVREAYINKLKNRIFGLLCEYEKEGSQWEALLDNILNELMGFENHRKGINYYIIWYKLSSARYLSYKYFRKAIFDVMNLLSQEED